MAQVSAVLFDFGMVLSGPPSPSAWQGMQQVSGLSADQLHQAYWAHRDDYDRGALNGDIYWKAVAAHADTAFDQPTRARLVALDLDLWTDMNEPMVEWVRQLHRAGMRTGILSNIGDSMAAGIRARFDWIADFHHAVWSHALRMRKPDLEIYAAAAKGLDVPPAHILFIDDREENIAAAIQSGMQAILYRSHVEFEREMVARGLAALLHPTVDALQTA